MTTNYVYFAYLDILGYRYYLKKDIKDVSLAFKDKMLSAFSSFNDVDISLFKWRSVSDSIFITGTDKDKLIPFLELIKNICVSFITNGLFMNGGISYGQHFETDRVTYSHALTQAYKLSQEAIYPRIVVDKNILQMKTNEDNISNIRSKDLLKYDGGVLFLNILDLSNRNSIYDAAKIWYAESKKDADNTEALRIKHIWFQKYLLSNTPSGQAAFTEYISGFGNI